MSILLGVVTDEVSQNPHTALAWARERNLDYVDIRDVWGVNITDLSEQQLADLEESIRISGLKIMTICPQLFRAELDADVVARVNNNHQLIATDEGEYAAHLRLLLRSLDLAQRFNAPYIRTFGFWREEEPEDVWDTLVTAFKLAASLAQKQDRILLLENEAVTYAVSGGEAAKLINAVDSEHFRAIWDPGNGFFHPEVPFPHGYYSIRDHIRVIHAKDASEKGFTVMGEGKLDWEGQLRAIKEDRLSVCISVEPRTAPPGQTVGDASESILAWLRDRLD